MPGIEADGPDVPAEARRRLRVALHECKPDVVYVQVAASPGVAAEAMGAAPVLVYAHDHGMVCPGNARYLHRSASYCAEGPGLRCFERAYGERCTNRRPDRVLRPTGAPRRGRASCRGFTRCSSPPRSWPASSKPAGAEDVKVVPYPVEARPRASASLDARIRRPVRREARRREGREGADRALAKLPGATAAIAGDGPERSELEALAGSLGIGERVTLSRLGLAGGTARAVCLEAACSAFPALWQEPFGLIGVEALAAGLPVVASEVGGIPSWLADGARRACSSLRATPGSLASALGRVLDDGSLREELSAAGPVVAARFSVERHLDLLLPELLAA